MKSPQKRIPQSNFRWKAVLTAYKIKINRKLQRLHTFLILCTIDKGEALFQIFKNAVLILYDILQSVKFSLHQPITSQYKSRRHDVKKSLRRSNFRWKAALTAYKIKIKRKLQRLHNFVIRYLIDKGEALFQIFKKCSVCTVFILYDQ